MSFSCKRKQVEIVIIPDALKNHLQRVHLFGNVNNTEIDNYFYKDSSFIFIEKNILFYNSDGYLTQVIVLDQNSDTASIKNIYYLPNGQENFFEEINYNDFSRTIDTFLYDRNGYKIEEWYLFNDSILHKIQYKTDGIGGVIEMKRLLPDYHLTNKIYYNTNGLIERIEEYDPYNILYKFFTIEYDNYGYEVNRRVFKNNNEIIEYTYTQYNNEESLLKIIFEDCLHNLREDKIYTHHDEKGNWIEEIVLQGSDTVGKRVRQIGYY
jgi:hypothetical protein